MPYALTVPYLEHGVHEQLLQDAAQAAGAGASLACGVRDLTQRPGRVAQPRVVQAQQRRVPVTHPGRGIGLRLGLGLGLGGSTEHPPGDT
jgi:hypothetical protein